MIIAHFFVMKSLVGGFLADIIMWMGSIRMDMAVGIIIGGAFTSIVSSLVEDIINPFLGIFGGMNFDKLHWNIVGDVTLNYGKFLTAVMNS